MRETLINWYAKTPRYRFLLGGIAVSVLLGAGAAVISNRFHKTVPHMCKNGDKHQKKKLKKSTDR